VFGERTAVSRADPDCSAARPTARKKAWSLGSGKEPDKAPLDQPVQPRPPLKV
jgi:hypothetical protein